MQRTPTQPGAEVTIRCRSVELVQRGKDLYLRHNGKIQTTELQIDEATLERWALRQLREGIFS